MPRYLLLAVIVFATIFALGYWLSGFAAKRQTSLIATRNNPENPNARKFGYRYLFACWLVCSVVITALIWEYGFS